MIGKNLKITPHGTHTEISFCTVDNTNFLLDLLDKPLRIEMKQYYQKRTNDANAYLWVLIRQLAEKLNLPTLDVYRKSIKEAGFYDIVGVRTIAADQFKRSWESNGYGYIAEIENGMTDDWKRVRVWYGTSTYDSKQFSRLLDYVIDEAKAQGIETLSKSDLELLNNYTRGK